MCHSTRGSIIHVSSNVLIPCEFPCAYTYLVHTNVLLRYGYPCVYKLYVWMYLDSQCAYRYHMGSHVLFHVFIPCAYNISRGLRCALDQPLALRGGSKRKKSKYGNIGKLYVHFQGRLSCGPYNHTDFKNPCLRRQIEAFFRQVISLMYT
jgi:hypothetical protein